MAHAESATPGLSVLPEPIHEVNGTTFLVGLRSALAMLQANQDLVNDLNVFPVPDGDTGSNMYMTLRGAVEEAQRIPDTESASAVMAAVAHGSLMGARGNSGVILSQIFRGFAAGIESHAVIDAQALANGLTEAAAVAYRAVMKPTEGTVLTVVRESAEAARAAARSTDDIRVVLNAAVAEAHAAVDRTTAQLAVLRDAGVVDAGGFGFAVILEGFARSLTDSDDVPTSPRVLRAPSSAASGKPAGNSDVAVPGTRRGAAAVAATEEGFGYCTEFLIHGPGLDPIALRDTLGSMGESALVVGDEELVRVHIHTPEPAELIGAASRLGRLSKLKVEDMTAQHHDVIERADAADAAGLATPAASGNGATAAVPAREPVALAVVAVAPGPGFRDIFVGLGVAVVVEGGQTMNPSIEDMLNAVREANAKQVILLPNNGNVILTAQQVDALADGVAVSVVPTRNVPQGVNAMLALDMGASPEDNTARMREAFVAVTCIEVTRAVRNSRSNGLVIHNGDVIALVDDVITQVGKDEQAVIEKAIRSLKREAELITVYRGADVAEANATQLVETLRSAFDGVEFDVQNGGQEHYPYVLSVE